MSQNSDCPINKSVILSFDAKEGQQSTFPLESNLDVLISSMLKGINDEYTKPISVVPAGVTKDVPSPFVKLNTPDVVIVQPGQLPSPALDMVPPPLAPEAPVGISAGGASATVNESILPGVPTPLINAGESLSDLISPAPFNPTPIAPPAALVTPNQPPANVGTALPPLMQEQAPSPVVQGKVEKFQNGHSTNSIERSYLISKIIGILFLILIAYLVLVKCKIINH
jgi:hypothetical protein